MIRTLLTCVLWLLTTPLQAQMLLAEVSWQQPQPVTAFPASFSVTITDDNELFGRGFGVGSVVLNADSTASSTMGPNDGLYVFNDLLCYRNESFGVRLFFDNAGQVPYPDIPWHWFTFDGIWYPDFDPNDGLQMIAHAPRLSSPGGGEYWGLFGYQLTSIVHTATATGQTVYFYGILIPEPSSWLLCAIAGSAWPFRRRT